MYSELRLTGRTKKILHNFVIYLQHSVHSQNTQRAQFFHDFVSTKLRPVNRNSLYPLFYKFSTKIIQIFNANIYLLYFISCYPVRYFLNLVLATVTASTKLEP